MPVSRVHAVLPAPVQSVWEIVTSLENYAWRSDVKRIEIIGEKQFVEYTAHGFATLFTVVVQEPCRRWEFDMENDNISGRWIGLFTPQGGQTEIDFTENVVARKFFLKPFVKFYLKKQQARYLSDLRRAIEAKR